LIPNHWTKRAAEREDLGSTRAGMAVCTAFAVAFLGVRILEFATLNCSWDANAYASAVWLLLGLHTTHLITDFADTVVLAALMYKRPLERKRFVDVSENAFYWYFVVFAWLPIAAVIYIAPRIL
jgi:cytochrome c oxidase subunit I+III